MISIVIVHWNTPGLLNACLASVERECELERRAKRSLPEILVVDVASTDGAYRDIVNAYPRVRLIQMPANEGYAAGCNAGMSSAVGEVALFLNADIELQPGSLQEMLRPFSLAPHIGMVAPLLINPDGSVQSSGYRFPGIVNVLCDLLPVPGRLYRSSFNGRYDPGNGIHPYAIDYALGAALAVRRTAFMSTGGFDEDYGMYCEEIDFARRLERRGWTRLLAPAARVTHVGGASTRQMPAEMQTSLWRSRGRYHRLWDTGTRRRAIPWGVRIACEVRSRGDVSYKPDTYSTIRAAFDDGFRCPA